MSYSLLRATILCFMKGFYFAHSSTTKTMLRARAWHGLSHTNIIRFFPFYPHHCSNGAPEFFMVKTIEKNYVIHMKRGYLRFDVGYRNSIYNWFDLVLISIPPWQYPSDYQIENFGFVLTDAVCHPTCRQEKIMIVVPSWR